jgi:ABC-type transport system substrate-binding protein
LTTATTIGLAGCSGDPDNTATDSPTSGEGTSTTAPATTAQQEGEQVTDTIATHVGAWQPSNTNLNRYAPAGNEPAWLNENWFSKTLFRNNKGEITYHSFDDVEFKNDGKEVVFHLNENYKWWDGTPLTAEDYVIQRQINQYQQHGSLEKANVQVEVVDDYTAKEVRQSPVNPTARLLGHISPIYTKRSFYREWLERYEDASSEDEVDSITQELTQTQISFQEAVDNGMGSGLFKPTDWNPTRVTWEKFDDHPRADWTNLEEWTWELVEGDQKLDQAFQSGRFDMGELNFDLVAKEDDNIENVVEMPLPGVPKLTINFDNKHLARRGVRQAIAHIIDHDEIREVLKANFGTPYQPHPDITGMASPVGDTWLGSDFLGKLNDYGSKAQPEKARQAMENAGYSKDGEYWVGPDGDEVTGLTYISPPWAIYQQIEKYLSPKLNEFGIGNEQVLPSRSNFYKRLNETYEFDLLNAFHFGFHPTTSYFVDEGWPSGFDNYRAVAEPVDDVQNEPELTNDTSPRLKHPIRSEFPSEVGDNEMSGSSETLYPIKWNNIMGSTQNRDEIVNLARKLAWYYNWQVPHIGFYEEIWNYWGRTDKYTFRGNHPDSETERVAREHTIANDNKMQVSGGHVSSKME